MMCCGEQATLLGTGHVAGFRVEVWHCERCSAYRGRGVRMRSSTAWSSTLADKLHAEKLKIIGEVHGLSESELYRTRVFAA